jgi:hypothetical protein
VKKPSKLLFSPEKAIFFASLTSLKKGVESGVGSGSISQRYGSAPKCHGSPTLPLSYPTNTHLLSRGSGSWDRAPCCRASAPSPHCWPAGDPETSSASSAVMSKFFFNADPDPTFQLIPSNLLILWGGINFVTPTANFCLHLLGLLHKISKNFKNKFSFKYFSLLLFFLCQKVVHIKFFEDLHFVRFCDEINFEKSKKSPRKHQQGGNLEDSYSHEKFI